MSSATPGRPRVREFLLELSGILPDDRMTTQRDRLDALSRDQTYVLQPGRPLVAAFPVSTDEVSGIARAAASHGVPIVARGEGSGLAGGATAIDDCLILSFAGMNQIVEVDIDDRVAVVQPGVINAKLQATVAAHGLLYAPDPSSFEISSIGGNIATNAGGLRCAKHGVTRESVLALEVVLADGSVLRIGHRSIKGVAGYDLTALFVGSEGTLGLITQATLRLRPASPEMSTVLSVFASLEGAGKAVSELLATGLNPTVLEIMDRTTLLAIEDWQHRGIDLSAQGALVIQAEADSHGANLVAIEKACTAAGATDVFASTDLVESESLMDTRRAAFPALERQGATLLEDVAVSSGRLVDLIRAIQNAAARHNVTIGTFGHAADGNLHPTLVWRRGDEQAHQAALRAAEEILDATLALGGTVTGEHGIGLLKRGFLERELGPEVVKVSKALKATFDPLGILNPGKVFMLE